MKPRNKAMLIGLIVFSVAMLVMVIVGVMTHEEPGLLPEVPQWSRTDFPLGVRVTSYRSDGVVEVSGDDQSAVTAAMSLVNSRLGFPTFRSVSTDAAIWITVGVPYDSEAGWEHPGGHSEIRHTGGRAERCDVETSNTGTQELLVLTLYHELGHCLGLAHDDFTISIMYPEQRETPDRQIPPWITDSDRALLRDLYGPR